MDNWGKPPGESGYARNYLKLIPILNQQLSQLCVLLSDRPWLYLVSPMLSLRA